MDQFTFMVDTLTDYSDKWLGNYIRDTDELTNESLALVESTLLHGYTITDVAQFETTEVKQTKRVN
jgi:hypothetical protein